jgi:cytochrome c peroxidase
MNRGLWALLALVALVLAVQALNLVLTRPSGTTLGLFGAANPHVRPVALLLEQKCAHCHTTDVQRPFYAWIPGLRQHLTHDARQAMLEFDLVEEFVQGDGGTVSEPALAKIEYVVERHSMPPGDFRAMHWDAHLDDGDRVEILAWIRDVRRHHYAPEDLPPAVQENTLHPLPAVDPRLHASAVALGERLYYDVRLSADGSRSCATCHDLERGGCDHRAVAQGIGNQLCRVNTLTTFNALYQRAQGWYGNAATLEEMIARHPENPVKMGANWPEICAALEHDREFARAFQAVYPDGFTKTSVTSALAAFQRTLVTPHARFDRYLLGETAALTDQEQRGYALFRQAGCQNCHVGRALGGQSCERMGRRADYFAARGGAAPGDAGRIAITRDPADQHVFKVPSLRNVARTAPYLHDGSVADLRQATDIMLRYQVGAKLPDADAECIVAFLATLTGEYRGKPL